MKRRLKRLVLRALRVVGLEQKGREFVGRRRERSVVRRPTKEQRRCDAIEKQIADSVSGRGPLVVGPWLSEVGFEVLYWIPFLRWVVERFDVDPGRVHVISRGGAACWYRGIAGHYIDIFDLMQPAEFRARADARQREGGGQKQMHVTGWDREVLERAAGGVEARPGGLLHPSLMFELFRHYWTGPAEVDQVLARTSIAPFERPPDDEWSARLPEGDFVAVRFYYRPSFPNTPLNQRAVSQVVSALAGETDVVLLNTGLVIDDHPDANPGNLERVTSLLEGVPPNLNLHAQSQAISRARAFVGTYGGLSYLAPLYGVGSITYFSEPQHVLPSHLNFARRTAAHTGGYLVTASSREPAPLGLLEPLRSLGGAGAPA